MSASLSLANVCVPENSSELQVVRVPTDDTLNVRAGYTTEFDILFKLKNSTKNITFLGHAYKTDQCKSYCKQFLTGTNSLEALIKSECRQKSRIWYLIRMPNGSEGWTSAKYLAEYDALSNKITASDGDIISAQKKITKQYFFILRKKDRITLHEKLKSYGFYTGTVDGLWGKNTEKAFVRYFNKFEIVKAKFNNLNVQDEDKVYNLIEDLLNIETDKDYNFLEDMKFIAEEARRKQQAKKIEALSQETLSLGATDHSITEKKVHSQIKNLPQTGTQNQSQIELERRDLAQVKKQLELEKQELSDEREKLDGEIKKLAVAKKQLELEKQELSDEREQLGGETKKSAAAKLEIENNTKILEIERASLASEEQALKAAKIENTQKIELLNQAITKKEVETKNLSELKTLAEQRAAYLAKATQEAKAEAESFKELREEALVLEEEERQNLEKKQLLQTVLLLMLILSLSFNLFLLFRKKKLVTEPDKKEGDKRISTLKLADTETYNIPQEIQTTSYENQSPKSRKIALILCLSIFGGHRFYVGKIGTGFLQLITAGGFYVWTIIDFIKIYKNQFTDIHGRLLARNDVAQKVLDEKTDKPVQSSLSILLKIGIFIIPQIFAWLTLRKSVGSTARIVSFMWMIFYSGTIGILQSDKPNLSSSVKLDNPTPRSVQAVNSTSTQVSPTSSSGKSDGVMKITSVQLVSDYEANEVGADNKYKGKVYEISGEVEEVKKDVITDKMYVSLRGDGFFRSVAAYFDYNSASQLGAIRKGQQLIVSCQIDGLMMAVLVNNCKFVSDIPIQAVNSTSTQVSPTSSSGKSDGVMKITSVQLVSDYEANEVGADNKYKGKVYEISGEVEEVKKDVITDKMYVSLRGDGFFRSVAAYFDYNSASQLGAIRKGQQLIVSCQIDGLMMAVLVSNCVIQ